MGVSATLEQLAASKEGKVFICTLPRPYVNEVDTWILFFREGKSVFPDLFIIAYTPLFCQVCKLLFTSCYYNCQRY